jgi:hypothetical protein
VCDRSSHLSPNWSFVWVLYVWPLSHAELGFRLEDLQDTATGQDTPHAWHHFVSIILGTELLALFGVEFSFHERFS